MQVPNGSATVIVRPLSPTLESGSPRDRAAAGVQSWHTTVHLASSPVSVMNAPRKAALLWSGGKDSALALHHASTNHPSIEVVKLVTCMSQAYDRVSMHGVRRQLISNQGVDACGERGEYHSFTFDGPPFRHPVAYRPGEVHHHAPFVFQELLPGEPVPAEARFPILRLTPAPAAP